MQPEDDAAPVPKEHFSSLTSSITAAALLSVAIPHSSVSTAVTEFVVAPYIQRWFFLSVTCKPRRWWWRAARHLTLDTVCPLDVVPIEAAPSVTEITFTSSMGQCVLSTDAQGKAWLRESRFKVDDGTSKAATGARPTLGKTAKAAKAPASKPSVKLASVASAKTVKGKPASVPKKAQATTKKMDGSDGIDTRVTTVLAHFSSVTKVTAAKPHGLGAVAALPQLDELVLDAHCTGDENSYVGYGALQNSTLTKLDVKCSRPADTLCCLVAAAPVEDTPAPRPATLTVRTVDALIADAVSKYRCLRRFEVSASVAQGCAGALLRALPQATLEELLLPEEAVKDIVGLNVDDALALRDFKALRVLRCAVSSASCLPAIASVATLRRLEAQVRGERGFQREVAAGLAGADHPMDLSSLPLLESVSLQGVVVLFPPPQGRAGFPLLSEVTLDSCGVVREAAKPRGDVDPQSNVSASAMLSADGLHQSSDALDLLFEAIGASPRLRHFKCTRMPTVTAPSIAAIAKSPTLRHAVVRFCAGLGSDAEVVEVLRSFREATALQSLECGYAAKALAKVLPAHVKVGF